MPPLRPAAPITPAHVLSSPLDGTSVAPPAVTVNQDRAAAPQNETAIAVDPNNPMRIVAAANDYVTRTWTCTVGGQPCSALGDGYSGTYYSNDGGATWCCAEATDPAHLGTLIPGVKRLAGGTYDAGGDPALAFDSRGTPFYAGLGFNRTSPPNTVAVNRGSLRLEWCPLVERTDLHQPDDVALNTERQGVDRRRRQRGQPVPGPGLCHVDAVPLQRGQRRLRPVADLLRLVRRRRRRRSARRRRSRATSCTTRVRGRSSAPDGAVHVFFEGSTRLASLNSTYVVTSHDGGVSWGSRWRSRHSTTPRSLRTPRSGSTATRQPRPHRTVTSTRRGRRRSDDTSTAVYSRSTDGGATWSDPTDVFAPATRTPVGYPVTQPDGSTLTAPAPRAVEDVFPAIDVAGNGRVYIGSYRGTVVSPWQTCASGPEPPVGRITCDTLGNYIDNTRLDFVVTDVTTHVTQTMSTHPINTRNGFGGGFIGDYNDLSAGPDGTFHAFWTDTNNVQTVTWFYGTEFVPTPIHQEDVVTASGNF